MAVAPDENFGPVVPIVTFETVEEVISMALETDYGLAAAVWSKNIDKVQGVIRKMRAGRCWRSAAILAGRNNQWAVSSDLALAAKVE